MANMQYEIAVVYDPGLEVDLSKGENRVTKIFTDAKAEVKDTDNWGKKKLAYPVNKHEHGIYVFYTVEMPPENVGQVESKLNITDEVIRYLVVKQDEKTLKKMAEAKEAKEKAAKRAEAKKDEDKEDEANEE